MPERENRGGKGKKIPIFNRVRRALGPTKGDRKKVLSRV